ncbi:MAG: aminodeoxychorismate/anthranilate synthase component II [Deltaproteobacteria bacterium]|jgi:para-aminobenzoate synthetase component 2|nr:aminodeoxychorismate/anthranilate synthase component II [Deltaproteobacteria bacterium]
MILLIDNYDSFTFNLVQYLGELGATCLVYRNDQIDLSNLCKIKPQYLVVSPGPCTPQEAGISERAILQMAGQIPVLGVCLGHQCIGSAFGGKIIRAQRLMHGKSSLIYHDGKTLYRGLPSPFPAIRYHSLLIERESLPECLEISAETKEGEIMGVRHKVFPMEGVQFHPESIMTQGGKIILKNFLAIRENNHAEKIHC